MNISIKSKLSEKERRSILEIWNAVYPKQIRYQTQNDLEEYLSKYQSPTHIVAKNDQGLIGWLSTFDRQNERWFALVIDPNFQRLRIGSKMIAKMKTLEKKVHGWIVLGNHYEKFNGEKYHSPSGFYEKNGFQITDDVFETDVLSTVKIVWQEPR